MGDRGEGTRAALADALERARAATAGSSAADSCAAAPAGGPERGGHEAGAGGASAALSVSAAMALAKGALEGVVVRLVGEVSETSSKRGYKAVYFTVKDADAALPCMMWMGRYKASGVDLAVGQLVELTGRFTLYAAKGRMNFDVFSIELAGEGRLRAQVAALARKLEAEGLMDPARKLPVPQFPLTIGIVTSPRGDAVHDMLRTLRNRFPVARVFVAGVQVEGAQAAASIVEGMRCLYRAGVEVMLVGRGGGSYEDMMPFNDEALARAIAACPIPVVTGIGHEPDTFIADMVADRRASTPTYAAMAVTPTRESLAELFCAHARSLSMSAGRAVERTAAEVRRCAERPVLRDPNLLLAAPMQGVDLASERLFRAIPANLERDRATLDRQRERLARLLPEGVARERAVLERCRERLLPALPANLERDRMQVGHARQRLASLGPGLVPRFGQQAALAAARLEDLSPLSVIGRGYAIARTQEGAVAKRVEDAPPGSALEVTVSDGVLACRVESARREDIEMILWEDEDNGDR